MALAAASAVITMRAQQAGGSVASLLQHPLSVRLENALVCYVRYIGKVFWPSQLAPLVSLSHPVFRYVASPRRCANAAGRHCCLSFGTGNIVISPWDGFGSWAQ